MEVDLKTVLRAFRIENPESVEGIGSGLINETYKVETATDAFILQRINKEIFVDPALIMENIKSVEDVLVELADYQVPKLINTESGKLYHVDEDGYAWRMMRYISGSTTYDQAKDVKTAEEAGRLIGLFHRATSGMDAERLHVTLPNFHDLGFRSDLFLGSLQNADSEKLAKASDSIEFLEKKISDFDQLIQLNVPRRVTHNDTKLNNLLFDRSGKGLCLIDLDTLMPGYLYHDFSDAIRTLCNSISENGRELEKLEFDIDLFQHFTKGYLCETKNVLTEEEWMSIPLSIEFMPFIMGLRFLTDYLYGNIYYKTDYSDQNLDRCKNQFAFVRKMGKQRGEIARIVQSYR